MPSQVNQDFGTWVVEGNHYNVSFIAPTVTSQEDAISLAIQSGYVFEWERDSLQARLEGVDA